MRHGDYAKPIPVGGPPEISPELRGGKCAGCNACAIEPGQSRSDAPPGVAPGRRAARSRPRISRRTRTAAVQHPRRHDCADRRRTAGEEISAFRPRRCCNRSRPSSRPTAVSSTGCGRSTSRNSAFRPACRRCSRTFASRHPASRSRIGSDLNGVDGPLAQTVYRVIQEALTNVLRHAKAGSAARPGDHHR